MSMIGAEVVIIDDWVEQALLAHAPLQALVGGRVFNRYAPDPDVTDVPTEYPFIIFQSQHITDVTGSGPARLMVDALYVVKAIAEGDNFRALAPVVAAMDAALTSPPGGIAGTVEGGLVLSCVRQEPFTLAEVDGANQFRHLGGIYRIQAQAV